jgi:sugar diacid utilization regulator
MTVLSTAAIGSGDEEPEVLAIERTAAALGLRAVVIARGDGYFLLTNAVEGELGAIAEQVLGSLRGDREVTAASIGIGSLVADAGELRISLSEARQACTLAANRKEAYAIVKADQAGSHDLLLAIADSEIRSTFAARLIEPLRAYDKRRGAELIRTVSTFLENGCKWQQTAGELNVHVNTLRHRFSRIESLTGRDLNEMEARVDFFLALRADRMATEHKIREPSPRRQPG